MSDVDPAADILSILVNDHQVNTLNSLQTPHHLPVHDREASQNNTRKKQHLFKFLFLILGFTCQSPAHALHPANQMRTELPKCSGVGFQSIFGFSFTADKSLKMKYLFALVISFVIVTEQH